MVENKHRHVNWKLVCLPGASAGNWRYYSRHRFWNLS